MENLCESASNGCEGTYDVLYLTTRTGRPVCGLESTQCCVLMLTKIEEDQTGTERPVLVDQKEEHKIDFRVPALSHEVLKKQKISEFMSL